MQRRHFLQGITAAGLLPILDPAYLLAKEMVQAGKSPTKPVERRSYGRTADRLSVIGFATVKQ